MAEINSYVTGVGPYPTAPNTSVQQFLNEHPEYTNGSSGGNKWWSDIANVVSSGQDYPSLNVHYKDWLSFRRQYDDWVAGKTLSYNSLVKTWEAAQKSPLNQSELLEAAGYNRNWLQGAVNSGVDAAPPVEPVLSNSGQGNADPTQQIFQMLSFGESVLNSILSFQKGQAEIQNVQANTKLLNERAITEEEMRPFNIAPKYYKAMKEHNEMYGAFDELYHMPYTVGSGITFQGIPEDSYYNKMLDAKLSAAKLYYQGLRLNNHQKRYVLHTLMPIQKAMFDLQSKFMKGQLDLQEFDLGLRRVTQPAMLKYAPKMPAQQYIQGWLHTGLDFLKAGAGFLLNWKKFNTQLDFDLFKSDGDFGHLDRYY